MQDGVGAHGRAPVKKKAETEMTQIENLRTEAKFKKTEIGELPVSWRVIRIKDVCRQPEYGYTASAIEEPVGPKMLRITDIQDGRVLWDTVPHCKCPENIKNKFLLYRGDILFARTGATTGKSYLVEDCPEAVFASYLIRIVTEKELDYHYLYFLFDSTIYWNQIKQKIGGSAQGGVNASLLSELRIPLPPLAEQKKIAEILLSVDSAIEKSNQLVEKKKELKKGLMQELLTKGMQSLKSPESKESRVRRKFKKTEIGEIPEGWEVIKLKNILTLSYGDGLPEEKRKAGAYPVYGSNGVIGYHDTALVKGPGIIVGRKGTIGSVEWSEKDFWPIDTTYYVSADNEKFNLRWLYYQLQILKLNKLNTATGIPGLNREVALNSIVSYPPIFEQKKIAEILSSVDEEIEKEVAEKEKLEQLKKGLMQVLLTGRVRVGGAQSRAPVRR